MIICHHTAQLIALLTCCVELHKELCSSSSCCEEGGGVALYTTEYC